MPRAPPGLGTASTLLLGAAAAAASLVYLLPRHKRTKTIKPSAERVLVLGASSGVGRAVAKKYVERGARVCVVARRSDEIVALARECGCLGVVADFSVVEDLVGVREKLLQVWGGLDTIHVCAGVSALQPLMALTGTQSPDEDADGAAIQKAVDIAGRATQGNFVGPLAAVLTFIPTLTRTSPSPSILLVSSLAAVVPAPTRALYAATKAASLLLYQALAIEHPGVAFTLLLPATIAGNFRASAVDSGPVREADPNRAGMSVEYVADRCVEAVDGRVRGNVVLPWFPYALAHHLYYLWPAFIEWRASRKYNFRA